MIFGTCFSSNISHFSQLFLPSPPFPQNFEFISLVSSVWERHPPHQPPIKKDPASAWKLSLPSPLPPLPSPLCGGVSEEKGRELERRAAMFGVGEYLVACDRFLGAVMTKVVRKDGWFVLLDQVFFFLLFLLVLLLFLSSQFLPLAQHVVSCRSPFSWPHKC